MTTTSVFSGSPRRCRNNINQIQKPPSSILSTTLNQTNHIGLLILSSTPTSSKQYHNQRHRANSQGLPSSSLTGINHQPKSPSLS